MKTKVTVTTVPPASTEAIGVLPPLPPCQAMFIRMAERPLNEEELRRYLGDMPPMVWRALNQVLASRQLSAVADASDAVLSDRLQRASGRLAESSELIAQLWRLAGKTPAP